MTPDPYSRIPRAAGWRDNGRRQPACRACGAEVPAGRRTFCGEPCVHGWKLRTSPGYARARVLERDHGVCAACGLDCEALRAEVKGLIERASAAMRYNGPEARARSVAPWIESWASLPWSTAPDVVARARAERHGAACAAAWLKHEAAHTLMAAGWKRTSRQVTALLRYCGVHLGALWQADHIVPVAEGGADLGLENLRTLCSPCHSRETGALRRRLRERRGGLSAGAEALEQLAEELER